MEKKISLKEIITSGLSWTDWLKCLWASLSIFGAPLYGEAAIEAPFWVFCLVLLNMYLSAKAVNTVKWPEEKSSTNTTE